MLFQGVKNICPSKIDIIHSGSARNNEIVQSINELRDGVFYPSWVLPFRTLEILYGYIVDHRFQVKFEREILINSVGENLALDWMKRKGDSQRETISANDKIVLIVPGLTGDSDSNYVQSVAHEFQAKGFKCAVFHPQGTAIPLIKSKSFDFRNNARDLKQVLKHIKSNYAQNDLFLLGFSFGACTSMRVLSEDDFGVKAVVSIANPFDFMKTATEINKLRNCIYG